jgi:hypothetical protein
VFIHNKKLLAASLALVVAGTAAFFLWPRSSAPTGSSPPAGAGARPPPEATRATGESAAAMPPGPARVDMDDDPVGPLLLEGQVVDADDQPVGGATVRLSSNPPRTAKSDADGSFSFDKLLPRAYTLSARHGDQIGGPVVHTLRGTSDPVVIRLAAGASIDVTVVAAAGGKPIAGAEVRLSGDDTLSTTTDAAGAARLRGVSPGPFTAVNARARGYAPAETVVQVPSSPAAVVSTRIELRRGAAVSGLVVDEAGAPIANARVSERAVSSLYDVGEEEDDATTDDKGRFSIEAVPAGTYRFHARHPRYAPGSSEPRQLDGEHAVADVRITLQRGARLAGRVVDRSDAPVPWATVRVGPPVSGGAMFGDFTTRQAVTDERGAFEMEGLPRGKLLALARSEEASSPAVSVDVTTGDQRDVVLRLDVAGRIEGIVVDPAGQPVVEARVTAYPDFFGEGMADDFGLRGASVEGTDGGGRFAFRGLPPGGYRLMASRSGATDMFFGRKTTKAATGDTGVRLVLETDGGIRGRVQFAGGGSPALFTVSIGFASPLPVSSRDGTFELPGVPPGKHDLAVRGPDFAEKVVSGVAVDGGQVRDVGVITVEKGRSVSGRVLGPGGAPVEGATVVLAEQILSDGKSLASSIGQALGSQLGMRQATSDADGQYSIIGIGKDKDLVLASEHESEGRSPPVKIPLGEDSVTIDLRLGPTGSLAGVVTAGGKPAAVQVLATAPGVARQNIVVTSGADGAYQIERMAAGEYKVSAMVGAGMGMTMAAKRVRIDPGKQARLDIDVPIGDITLSIQVEPKGEGTIDAAQIFLFAGKVSVDNAKSLNEAITSANEAGGVQIEFERGTTPARFTNVSSGSHSLCILPITGDLNDPAFTQRLMAHPEKLLVVCQPHLVPESPKEQSYTARVPPMAPLD